MITTFSSSNNYLPIPVTESNIGLIKTAVWVDMLCPTSLEEKWVEKALSLSIPTQEEMREIEASSRLYHNHDALFMTATMVAQSSLVRPKYDAVTFILTQYQLITVRYIEPKSFQVYASSLAKKTLNLGDEALDVFLSLLETSVDRIADVLEVVGITLDDYSEQVFEYESQPQKLDYKQLMHNIGTRSNLNTKARESLVTLSRLMGFFLYTADNRLDKEGHLRVSTLNKDLLSLSDYANFISNKVNFLLDATLGMVSIEQSAIIKIFSVAAVIFLPPTLIASIYGMNFQYMPELAFKWGYEFAICLMVFSAWLPYKYFKYKKWL